MKKKKKYLIGVLLFALFLAFVFHSDDIQQERFYFLRSGYHYMLDEQPQYELALAQFEKYLDVDSELYWFWIENVNNEFYSRDEVQHAIAICKAKMQEGE